MGTIAAMPMGALLAMEQIGALPMDRPPLRKRFRVSTAHLIVLGFLAAIAVGTALLMLPIATQDGRGAPLVDALFTATSATCVTGLIVHDTATYWSLFGQIVILLMIQLGGMGVVTVVVALAVLSRRHMSLRQRGAIQESLAAPAAANIMPLVGFIVRTTLVIELAGALLLATVFCADFGLAQGLWYGLFHAVSAFCNAGFDLMGITVPYASLTAYTGQPVVNLVIAGLIVVGGIGFVTWDDVRSHGLHLRAYRMQTKVILTTTVFLIAIPTVYFFMVDFADLPLHERFLAALFQAVSPRTAGFNTVDLSMLGGVAVAITIVLMLVGGSPGSTAGGMKTTTLAALLSTTLSVFTRRGETRFFGRRIGDATVRSAVGLAIMYLVLFFVGGCAISLLEDLPLGMCLFETASAVGTVGLTLGITPGLGTISQLILIVLMYLGRVGGLTVLFAALADHRGDVARYPEERLAVG